MAVFSSALAALTDNYVSSDNEDDNDNNDDKGDDNETARVVLPVVTSAPDIVGGAAMVSSLPSSSFMSTALTTPTLHATAKTNNRSVIDPNIRTIYHNPKVEDLYAPVEGPVQAGSVGSLQQQQQQRQQRNHGSGHVQPNYISASAFDEQYQTFNSYGYAANPNNNDNNNNNNGSGLGNIVVNKNIIGNTATGSLKIEGNAHGNTTSGLQNFIDHNGHTVLYSNKSKNNNNNKSKKSSDNNNDDGEANENRNKNKNRNTNLDLDSFSAAVSETLARHEARSAIANAFTDVQQERLQKPERTKEAIEYENWLEEKRVAKNKQRKLAEASGPYRDGDVEPAMPDSNNDDDDSNKDNDTNTGTEKAFFHGAARFDYLGQPWFLPPKDKKKKATSVNAQGEYQSCFIPKKWEFTWSGHQKGVSCVRFFPQSGHLILSAGLDNKVKIWDVYNTGKCMQTYLGHAQAVKDVQFSNDGTKFISASFDRMIKLWDTETGKVLGRFTTGKVPHCIRFHPDDDKQNVLLAGMSDKKIVQFDMDTGNLEQEYDQHLGPVNSITFVDNNRRFVTSSDDKSLRVWEYGTPVVIKYIADPSMHSMPTVAVHPNGNFIACQSLDNQIVVYSTKERFRKQHKKVFKGHTNSGYACQVGFSTDGRFLMSGDANGRMFFWDWKSCKVYRQFKAHEGVCIGCEWNPREQSKVVTCGWDGQIKYWD